MDGLGPPPPTSIDQRQRAPGGHVTIKSGDPKERITKGNGGVLATVRRLEKGEVMNLLLGPGPSREWRVVKEALKQGMAIRMGSLNGSAFYKQKHLSHWTNKWKTKYPVLRLLHVKLVDENTLDLYFKPFEE